MDDMKDVLEFLSKESDKRRIKEVEYSEYVNTHIENVNKAWDIMKVTQKCVDIISWYGSMPIDTFIAYMDKKMYIHDESKYSREEWEPYRMYFYPVDEAEKEIAKPAFEEAWKHHYMNNHHHWDYWYKTNKLNAMPLDDIIEECCDWIAMSIVFPGTAYDFFRKRVIDKDCKEDEIIHLSPYATEVTEKILKAYYEANPKLE